MGIFKCQQIFRLKKEEEEIGGEQRNCVVQTKQILRLNMVQMPTRFQTSIQMKLPSSLLENAGCWLVFGLGFGTGLALFQALCGPVANLKFVICITGQLFHVRGEL